MSTPRERREVYGHRRWRGLRARILLAAGWACARCDRTASVVHHVKPLRDRPDLAFEPSNLQALCGPCHEAEHERNGTTPGKEAWRLAVHELLPTQTRKTP